MAAEWLPQREVWSLVGRIVHYCPLVPTGRFNINHLIRINGKSLDKNARVEIEDCVKRQMKFWLVVLNMTDGHGDDTGATDDCTGVVAGFFH